MNSWIFLLILLFLTPGSFSNRKTQTLNQTASEEAKPYFDKGLLLLHNFEYDDAREEFLMAQQKDPNFVMAYWGEAMTYDHPLWQQLDVEKSRLALKKFGSDPMKRLAKAKTELEKDFVQGVDILFGTGSKPDREKAYADHMAILYKKYPGNHDVAAFYALSLITIKKAANEWEEYNIKAAEITNAILKEDPNHAGALHYLIHADDHPKHASEGLDAARRYDKAASYAGHALHMPSHIYLALGMWKDVVQSNEISWQASVDRKLRKNLDNDEFDHHSYMWLTYAYLQQGRFQSAKQLIENEIKYMNELPSPKIRSYLLQMKGHYLFSTNEWNSPIADLSIKTDDLDAHYHFANLFLDGYKFFTRSNTAELENLIARFETDLAKTTQLQSANDGIPVCGIKAFANGRPTASDIRVGNRFLKQLKGLKEWQMKNLTEAERLFKETLPKDGTVVVGPLPSFFASYELYGKLLLANNRPKEALELYNKTLEAMPNRYLSLKGKLEAAKAMKDSKTESETKNVMMENLKLADAAAIKDLKD